MVALPLYLAIDVGTGSVRVAIFTPTGTKLAHASNPIITRNPAPHHYEQSTTDIWRALKTSVHHATTSLPPPHHPTDIAALAFDATCSLVACSDTSFTPVSISADQSQSQQQLVYDVILWLDRRAVAEASLINNHQHPAVKQVCTHFGGSVSPENEPPKLLWLHNHIPDIIQQSIFFDLADWLNFRCTADPRIRSSCTVACKWGWGSNEDTHGEWSKAFWETLNLGALCENDFHKIGARIVKPGQPVATLTKDVAQQLGLPSQCLVASPMIDAHAGALWSLGLDSPLVKQIAPSMEQRLAVIAGTSTCFIQLSKHPVVVKGVWGPFRDAVLPGYHVTEGGQSVTGKLLENTVRRHASYPGLLERVGEENVYDALIGMTDALMQNDAPDPAEDLHCLDYHAGNRSPLADPTLKGCMIGLTLEDDELDLALKFRATMQALCCGARCIVDAMVAAGHDTKLVTVCGGLCKSRFFVTELADCLGLPVAVSSEEDTVLLGGAILAKTAHSIANGKNDHVRCLTSSASDMTSLGKIITPNQKRSAYYVHKYTVYRKMQEDFQSYRSIMQGQSKGAE